MRNRCSEVWCRPPEADLSRTDGGYEYQSRTDSGGWQDRRPAATQGTDGDSRPPAADYLLTDALVAAYEAFVACTPQDRLPQRRPAPRTEKLIFHKPWNVYLHMALAYAPMLVYDGRHLRRDTALE